LPATIEGLAKEEPLAFMVAFVSEALRREWGDAINTVMYISGKDAAREIHVSESSESLEGAVEKLNSLLGGHWRMEVEEREGKRYAVFKQCRLRELYRKAGIGDGKPLPFCFFHAGFIAGILERTLGRRVDLKPISRGDDACIEELILG